MGENGPNGYHIQFSEELSTGTAKIGNQPLKTRNNIQFLFNDTPIVLSQVECDQTLLDYIRLDRNLTGTKEGCAEGDCGACTILVGRLISGKLRYLAVNSCIVFLGSLDVCHIVTVEQMSAKGGKLHPLQQAMVDNHGSQCGFCTPGFVMSLYGLFLGNSDPDIEEIENALQGNLCRCTGYQPIINAALEVAKSGLLKDDPLVAARSKTIRALKAMRDGNRVDMSTDKSRFFLPADVDDFARLMASNPDATIVSGATDAGLWVTKHFANISPTIFISHLEELTSIKASSKGITIGAVASYLDTHNVMKKYIPSLGALWDRIGGAQVRNMGTIGGNIANGSPIGDTPPPLIVLNAQLQLRKGKKTRTIPLENFFIEYGKQDLRRGEFVESVHIPVPAKSMQFNVYKVSKRRDEDISAVCGAFLVDISSNGMVKSCRIAFGGMAGTPARAARVERAVVGKSWSRDLIDNAMPLFEQDYQPLSDWRASADYRMQIAKNMLLRFYLESTGEDVQLSRRNPTRQREGV